MAWGTLVWQSGIAASAMKWRRHVQAVSLRTYFALLSCTVYFIDSSPIHLVVLSPILSVPALPLLLHLFMVICLIKKGAPHEAIRLKGHSF